MAIEIPLSENFKIKIKKVPKAFISTIYMKRLAGIVEEINDIDSQLEIYEKNKDFPRDQNYYNLIKQKQEATARFAEKIVENKYDNAVELIRKVVIDPTIKTDEDLATLEENSGLDLFIIEQRILEALNIKTVAVGSTEATEVAKNTADSKSELPETNPL